MKKALKKGLIIAYSLSLIACGDNTEPSNNKTENGKNENEVTENGHIETIKSDWITLDEGSEAHDHWYCDKYYYEYKFKADGTCEYYHTCYNFPDVSQYDYVNGHLEDANYKPTWNNDHSGFYLASSYISTMTTEKALNNFDEKYYAYTITYSNKKTKNVAVPSEEQKAADLLANLGITKAIFNIAPGTNPQIYGQTKVQIGCKLTCEGADVNSLNTYAAGLFDTLKAKSQDKKIYDYIDYYEEIAECPQVSSQFESIYFVYKFNDNKFNVKVSLNENELNVAIQINK